MKNLSGHKSKTLKEFYCELANFCDEHDVKSDLYGKGEFLNNFEKEIAELVGMEAGLFLPSGVMAQLIAIKIWGDKANSNTFACHESCHLIQHEEDSYKHLLNFNVELIGEKNVVPIARDISSLSTNVSSLVYELPMRHLGGDLPSWIQFQEIKEECKKKNIRLHIDGARIFECQDYYQKSVQEIVQNCDSLFLSFYKGFGSTSGSMLLSNQDFINQARIWLRRFGGNLYQLHTLAIPAKYNFDLHRNKFLAWFKKTKEIASVLKDELQMEVVPYPPKTNMFHVFIPNSMQRLKELKVSSDGINLNIGIWGEESPDLCRVEYYTADASLEFSKAEIHSIFSSLLQP